VACVNQCEFIGFMAADPEIRMTPAGIKTANFRIACTKSWNDQGGQRQERTEWVNCVAWRVEAERVQKYLRKGNRAYVRGELQTRIWEDKNGGGKRHITEIIVDRFLALSGHTGDNSDHYGYESGDPSPRRPAAVEDHPSSPSDDDSSLPF
jgi:single-strand DNA-binding protein